MSEKGQGCNADEWKAFACFARAHAIDPSNIEAIYEGGYRCLYGKGCSVNEEKGFRLLHSIKLDEMGGFRDSICHCLGECFECGRGAVPDLDMAYEWFKRSDRGDSLYRCAEAMIRLGNFPDEDINLLLQEGAEKEVPEAQTVLGIRLAENVECKDDLEKAQFWLRKTANQEDCDAQLALAKLLLLKENASIDEKQEAANLLDEVIQGNHASDALRYRAALYDEDEEYVKAFQLLEALSESGDFDAQVECGMRLLEGKGAEKNYARAFCCFEKAHKKGLLPSAAVMEGHCYEYGYGIAVNSARAARCYKEAAESYYPAGMYHYGRCLYEGIGLSKDEDRAADLIKKASEAGNREALEWISLHLGSRNSELDKLVGLKEVKRAVQELKDSIVFNQAASSLGATVPVSNRNMLFLGNPGTGKTTVARIIANELHELRVIKRPNIVEVDRNKLIGQYMGHTTERTQEAIKDALDGVLFIDEAYALIEDQGDMYGKEIVDTLVKAMTDYGDRLVVVMAGYEKEMDEFLECNSGLRSRFHYRFMFEDYSVNELQEIFLNLLHGNGFKIDNDAVKKAALCFEKARSEKLFGNGRFVGDFVQRVLDRHKVVTFNADDQSTVLHIVAEDIPEP